jgi:hypothetical protein
VYDVTMPKPVWAPKSGVADTYVLPSVG